MAGTRDGLIDEWLGSENPISPYIEGAKFAQNVPHFNNVVTAQVVPNDTDANFAVNVEVAVRGKDGDIPFSTLLVLTPSEPVKSFPYSVGCTYRMNYTGGTGTVLARMRG